MRQISNTTRKVAITRQPVGQQLAPSVTYNDQKITSVGTVARLQNNRSKTKVLKNITMVLDNSGGVSAVNYLLNDSTGVIAEVNNLTVEAPSSSTVTPAVMEKVLSIAPIEVKAINYEVAVSSTQFANAFEVVNADIDKSRDVVIIDPAASQRNNAFNSKLLTLEFENPIKLSWDQSIFITVAAGETVTLTLTPSASANR